MQPRKWDIPVKTKGESALEIIDAGIAAGLLTWAVLADAGYGDQPSFLEGLETRALPQVVGVASTTRFRLSQEVELDSGAEVARGSQQRRLETGTDW